MKTFEVTLKGFDGNTDATDHLVKWVQAENLEALNAWLEDQQVTEHLHEPPRLMDGCDHYDFADGVDAKVFSDGSHCQGLGPQQWVKDSLASN
jgi:hypothetical protein